MVQVRDIVRTLGGPKIRGLTGLKGGLTGLVRGGLPYTCLDAVAFAYGTEAQQIAPILHIPLRTLARRKKRGTLDVGESDGLMRLARIAALAEDILGDKTRAGHWLRSPIKALGGKSPLEELDTDPGAKRVEAVLMRLAHGVYS